MTIKIKTNINYSPCLLCGSRKTGVYLTVENWPYHLCNDCRCCFIPAGLLTGHEERHTGRSYKLSRLMVESKNQVHDAWLMAMMQKVQPFGRVLEVGCGAGFFLKVLSEAGYKVMGIDKGEENVIFGDIFLDVPVLNLDFLAFSEECSFDWVVMNQLLEHVPKPKEFVRKAKNLLIPGGYLLITTPNMAFARKFLAPFIMLRKKPPNADALGHPPNHCILFEPYTLRILLAQEGFRIVELGHNPTGFMGVPSLSLGRIVRKSADKCILFINKLLGTQKIIGPNMYCMTQKPGI